MATITVEADVEIEDIDNYDFIRELGSRLKKGMFDNEDRKTLRTIILGVNNCSSSLDTILKVELFNEVVDRYTLAELQQLLNP